MNYKELSALPSEAYLDPEKFRTATDSLPPSRYTQEQHKKGLLTGLRAREITISCSSVWGATMLDGGILSSYEGIGYHSRTAELLQGFLDSGCRIVVYRHDPWGNVSSTVIREYSTPHPLATKLEAAPSEKRCSCGGQEKGMHTMDCDRVVAVMGEHLRENEMRDALDACLDYSDGEIP